MTLADQLRSLLAEAAADASTEHAAGLAAFRRKLEGPLKVAIAGRMKAGKSTLLNALVGERLAPTDASECTRIVTWYEYASEYRVAAEVSGERFELPFRRATDGQLIIDMGDVDVSTVERLVVGWPSARLREMTLIDTPGLDSPSPDSARRTMGAIAGKGDEREADAILYLMRHAHRTDAGFLEAFHHAGVGQGTPVNSIAVLSRPDEIGAGRLDALDSTALIARRYEADPRMRALAATVLSVTGLLSESAATLEEAEAESLRLLAQEDEGTSELLLLSADHFCEAGIGPLTVELRKGLLRRLGMFGVRLAVHSYRAGQWTNATDLARLLSVKSGLPALREALQGRFASRSRQLVSRSVLLGLAELSESGALNAAVVRQLDQLESGDHEFAELAMLDLVLSGEAEFSSDERDEAERVTGPGSTAARAGCDRDASVADVQAAAVAGVARWRERAGDPLSSRITVRCAETMARCYEGMYVAERR